MAEVVTFDGTRRAVSSIAVGVRGLKDNPTKCLDTVGFHKKASLHKEGCYVLMVDGAFKFVSDTVDTGDLSKPSVYRSGDSLSLVPESPFGIWGKTGTIASERSSAGAAYE